MASGNSGVGRRFAPQLRAGVVAVAVAWCTAIPTGQERLPPSQAPTAPFHTWRAQLLDEAVLRGFNRGFVARILGTLQPSSRVLEADRAQAGPAPGLDAALSQRLTQDRIARGREKMGSHRRLLDRIERWFGVQRRFVVAIWGLESSYGSYTFDQPVFQALATLAWQPRRAAYFRAELFDALRIAQRAHIDMTAMRGSWAGAMGQPQFMPSSYLMYAYDFDRDGRRDIWRSTPDALASIANYLRSLGWQNGETWGREVRLTTAVREKLMNTTVRRIEGCGAIRALTDPRPLRDWATDGVRLADGSRLPRARVAASLLLTDAHSFLVYRNYEAILGYNCSHSYALSVAMLADRFR